MQSPIAVRETFPSFPQTGPISIPQGSTVIPIQPYQWKPSLEKFLKGEPKALGTVQIMIALINLGLGMIISFTPWNSYRFNFFLWYTGYIFWGSAFFIVSGSLSIAAANRTTRSLILSSLIMNIISSVVAGLGIIFYSINMVTFHPFIYFCHKENVGSTCNFAESILWGSNIFLLILTILELAISNVISGFSCKTICCVQNGVTIFMPPHTYGPENSAAEVSKGGTVFQSPDANIAAMP
ncbi:membrane-spanning 4-domains subfamily A member 4A-like isoform X1 [Macrotis lagotis]|uniref:membrane-spanning 4-domains subfamily A member 4A-like isoform X1 n=1 Tax=Macrotis lagotis TaxID=92651 RepID=UPI003D6966AC